MRIRIEAKGRVFELAIERDDGDAEPYEPPPYHLMPPTMTIAHPVDDPVGFRLTPTLGGAMTARSRAKHRKLAARLGIPTAEVWHRPGDVDQKRAAAKEAKLAKVIMDYLSARKRVRRRQMNAAAKELAGRLYASHGNAWMATGWAVGVRHTPTNTEWVLRA